MCVFGNSVDRNFVDIPPIPDGEEVGLTDGFPTPVTVKVYVPAEVPGSLLVVVPEPPPVPQLERLAKAAISINMPTIDRQLRRRAGIPRNSRNASTAPPLAHPLCLPPGVGFASPIVVVLGAVVVTVKFTTCVVPVGRVTV
jgi:hypothetical protein